jgi:hypothetical protein
MTTRQLKCAQVRIGNNEIVLVLGKNDTRELALEVALLLFGLTDGLLVNATGDQAMFIARHPDPAEVRGRVDHSDAARVDVLLARNQLEFIQAALLRAYRDGVAEVDHIHAEVTRQTGVYDVTLVFEHHRGPLPLDEAMRLFLGDPEGPS